MSVVDDTLALALPLPNAHFIWYANMVLYASITKSVEYCKEI